MRNYLDPVYQLLESREIELYSTPPTGTGYPAWESQ